MHWSWSDLFSFLPCSTHPSCAPFSISSVDVLVATPHFTSQPTFPLVPGSRLVSRLVSFSRVLFCCRLCNFFWLDFLVFKNHKDVFICIAQHVKLIGVGVVEKWDMDILDAVLTLILYVVLPLFSSSVVLKARPSEFVLVWTCMPLASQPRWLIHPDVGCFRLPHPCSVTKNDICRIKLLIKMMKNTNKEKMKKWCF